VIVSIFAAAAKETLCDVGPRDRVTLAGRTGERRQENARS
jgi:hypothetical protein